MQLKSEDVGMIRKWYLYKQGFRVELGSNRNKKGGGGESLDLDGMVERGLACRDVRSLQ